MYKYYRCHTCGLLVTDKMLKSGFCVGHKVQTAQRGSVTEWFLTKLNIYEPMMMRFARKGE